MHSQRKVVHWSSVFYQSEVSFWLQTPNHDTQQIQYFLTKFISLVSEIKSYRHRRDGCSKRPRKYLRLFAGDESDDSSSDENTEYGPTVDLPAYEDFAAEISRGRASSPVTFLNEVSDHCDSEISEGDEPDYIDDALFAGSNTSLSSFSKKFLDLKNHSGLSDATASSFLQLIADVLPIPSHRCFSASKLIFLMSWM